MVKDFPLRARTKQGCFIVPIQYIVQEVLVGAIRLRKKVKAIQIRKRMLCLFAGDTVFHIENSKESTRTCPKLINEFHTTTEYEVNSPKNASYFYILTITIWKPKFKKYII